MTSPVSPSEGSLESLWHLVNTALHDRTSYCPDEGYWQINQRAVADDAAWEVRVHFEGRDPRPEELALLSHAIATADGADLVEKLLFRLEAKAAPLIQVLLRDVTPDRRAAAVRLAGAALTPETWLSAMADPASVVRVAVVETLIRSHWLPDDSPRKPSDYKARVRAALADPSADVRVAAASSTYADLERTALVARLIGQTSDWREKRALRQALIGSDDCGVDHWHGGLLADPVVRAALVDIIAEPGPETRQFAIKRIGCRLAETPDDEDLSDFCIALFEQLLVEKHLLIVEDLLRVDVYPRITDHIIGRLTPLLADHLKMRFDVAYFLKRFGSAAVPLLERLSAQGGFMGDHARESLAAIETQSTLERHPPKPGCPSP